MKLGEHIISRLKQELFQNAPRLGETVEIALHWAGPASFSIEREGARRRAVARRGDGSGGAGDVYAEDMRPWAEESAPDAELRAEMRAAVAVALAAGELGRCGC